MLSPKGVCFRPENAQTITPSVGCVGEPKTWQLAYS